MRSIYRVLLTIFLLSTLFFAVNVNASDIEIKGDINIDTIWTQGIGPYVITGNISIARDVILSIEPGTIVKFKSNAGTTSSNPNTYAGYHIKVNGTLDAQGTDHNPILFTSEDKDFYWGHIEFTEDSAAWDEATASGSILSHCIIEYAGNGSEDGYEKAAVRSISASPFIGNNIIRYSTKDGIYTNSGFQTIIANRIHDTKCGIKLIKPEGARVENNYLIDNEQGIYLESGIDALRVSNNTVINSSSEVYGGCLGLSLLYHDNLLSYLWEQIAGPDVWLSDPNNVSSDPNKIAPSFVSPSVSSDELLTFQLTVTDREGLFSVDTVNINVGWENKRPVADAGADQNVIAESHVTLDGSNSIDPDAGALTYAWEQTSGPDVILYDSNSVQCTFKAPALSELGPFSQAYMIFQLMVTDSGGLQSKDTVKVLVKDREKILVPIADAGKGQRVNENEQVSLNGSLSIGTENQVISWLWEQTEGTDVEIINPTLPQAGFVSPEVGWKGESLIFRLTLTTGGDFHQSSDTVIVNVIDTDSNSPNLPPLVEAGTDLEVNEGSSVILDGSATDPNDTLESDFYLWEKLLGPAVTLSSSSAPNPSFTAPDVNEDTEMIFRLTVTDMYDLRSSDKVNVKVKWVNVPPQAHAGTDSTAEEGLKVLLDGSDSSDADDNILSYLWEQVGGTGVTLSNKTVIKPIFTAPYVLSNDHLIFRLTVEDSEGASDIDFVTVSITPRRKPPVADAGLDSVVMWGETVTLDGSASYDPKDPNNGIVSYLWEEKRGAQDKGSNTVTLYNATTAHPYFTAPQQGEGGFSSRFLAITFILTVQDKYGLKSTDSVIINITEDIDPNRMPKADAGPDQTVGTEAMVTLDGSKSIDPDFISEILIGNNHFINDNSEDTGNAIAIRENQGANCSLQIKANNIEKLGGNFLVYLYNWADKDSNTIDMTNNWWGTDVQDDIGAMIYDHDYDEYVPQVNYNFSESAEIAGAGSGLSYPPMAKGGEDQTADPDQIVTLDASGTHDPDGIMSYSWEQTGGQRVTINDPDGIVATFIAPFIEEEDNQGGGEEGILKFKLTVTDAKGFYDTDEVSVTINTPDDQESPERTGTGCFISSMVSDAR